MMLMVALALVATACGDGSDETTPTEPVPPAETEVSNGDVASPEFCSAYREFEEAGAVLIGGDVASLVEFYQGQAADLLEVAPDQVKSALEQIVAYDAAGATDAAGVRADLEEPVGEVSGFVLANCATAGSDPTFTFERGEGTGPASVLFVRGVCPDGSFPTDVTISVLFRDAIAATDLGDGLYSFGIELSDGADPNSPQVVEEIGVESGVDGSC